MAPTPQLHLIDFVFGHFFGVVFFFGFFVVFFFGFFVVLTDDFLQPSAPSLTNGFLQLPQKDIPNPLRHLRAW